MDHPGGLAHSGGDDGLARGEVLDDLQRTLGARLGVVLEAGDRDVRCRDVLWHPRVVNGSGEDDVLGEPELLSQCVQLTEAVSASYHHEGGGSPAVEHPSRSSQEQLAVLRAVQLSQVEHDGPFQVVVGEHLGAVHGRVKTLEVRADVGLEETMFVDAEPHRHVVQGPAGHRHRVDHPRQRPLEPIDMGADARVVGPVVEDLVLPVIPVVVHGLAQPIAGGNAGKGHVVEALLEVDHVGPTCKIHVPGHAPDQGCVEADLRDGLEREILAQAGGFQGGAWIVQMVDEPDLVAATYEFLRQVGDPDRPRLQIRIDVVGVGHQDLHAAARLAATGRGKPGAPSDASGT